MSLIHLQARHLGSRLIWHTDHEVGKHQPVKGLVLVAMPIVMSTRQGPDQHGQSGNDDEYTSFPDHFEASGGFWALRKKTADPFRDRSNLGMTVN